MQSPLSLTGYSQEMLDIYMFGWLMLHVNSVNVG